MSRVSQAISYINTGPKKLTNDWIKVNLTDITITESLKQIRKNNLKEIQLLKKT